NQSGSGDLQKYNVTAQAISIYKNNKLNSNFNNVSISDLKLIGDYKVIINSMGQIYLPYTTSQHNYIGVLIPTKFNMTIKLSSKPLASAEFAIQNQKQNSSTIDTIKVNDGATLKFSNIQTTSASSAPGSASSSKYIPILLKSP